MVIVMMPNGSLGLLALFAVNYLGAIFVPINLALKGSILRHVLSDSGAKFAVVGEGCLEQVVAQAPPFLSTIFSVEKMSGNSASQTSLILPVDRLHGDSERLAALAEPIEPWHTQCIIYTSGTTGRWTCTRAGDRHLLHMPIFHIGGALVASTCLCTGSSIAVVSSFKTGSFWQSVRDMNVNVVFLLGAMATFLLKAPPDPRDKSHPLRLVFIVPLGQSGPDFKNGSASTSSRSSI